MTLKWFGNFFKSFSARRRLRIAVEQSSDHHGIHCLQMTLFFGIDWVAKCERRLIKIVIALWTIRKFENKAATIINEINEERTKNEYGINHAA